MLIKHWNNFRRHTIEIYDDIEDLPVERYIKYQKNQLISNEVGADITDFDRLLQKLIQFINTGHKNKSLIEVNNLRNLFYNVSNEIDVESDAFSCLVKSINDHEYGHSESEITRITGKLRRIGFTRRMIKGIDVKKKINDQLKYHFPGMMDIDYDTFGAMKRKLIEQCNMIITGRSDMYDTANKRLSDLIQAVRFGGEDSAERFYEKKMNKLLAFVRSQTGIEAMSAYTFFITIENLRDGRKSN